jgi:hypothetical protein
MKKIRWYGFAGVILLAISWTANWHLGGLRTHIFFFPQWLGFILSLDALIYYRKNTSLINRGIIKFIMLFFISVPVWWIFELLNRRNHNWIYQGREYFTGFEYFVFASVCFSTVIPAVFEMTELIASFGWTLKIKKGPRIKKSIFNAYLFLILGILMLILDMWLPEYFYIFLWISIFFIFEGINILLKNKSLLQFTENGNWRPVYMLALGCCFCGFFWEFWNFYSYPKWTYRIPFLGFFKIFEMPVLGYLGYIPFSFELYSLYVFIKGIKENRKSYLVIE